MKRSILLGLFILSLEASSQNNEFPRQIVWTDPVVLRKPVMDDKTQYTLHFTGAFYDPEKHPYPVYREWLDIPITAGDVPVAELLNTRYVPLTEEEMRILGTINPSAIDNTVSVKTSYLRKKPLLEISFIPLRISPVTGRIEKLTGFVIRVDGGRKKSLTVAKAQHYKPQSVLSTGKWYRIRVENDGVYKITYSQIKSLGAANPSSVRIYGNGGGMLSFRNSDPRPDDLTENTIWMEKGSDNTFNEGDYVLFYGKGPLQWRYEPALPGFVHTPHLYSSVSYYFLTVDAGQAGTMPVIPKATVPETRLVNTFNDYTVHENDIVNLIKSGREWFEPVVNYLPYDIPLPFTQVDVSSPVTVRARVAARSPLTSSFDVKMNGSFLFNIPLSAVNISSYTSDYASAGSGSGSGIAGIDNNTISLVYNSNGVPSSECWIDYVTVNLRRKLIMTGDQLHFRDILSVGPGNVSKFTLSSAGADVTVWDITHPCAGRKVSTTLNGNDLEFVVPTDSLREFIAFRASAVPAATIEPSAVPNQNLHGLGPRDMVVITHPDFMDQAGQLADLHEAEGLRTVVVTPQQVYNEFSSGMPDVSALRNFMKMLYDRAAAPSDIPRFLLLFGDGSFDNKTEHVNNTNFILTYQSENALRPTQSFVTDDFFGLLDDDEGEADGLVDLGVGRLPAASPAEAQAMVDKIARYLDPSSHGDWKNIVCFIGDDEDYNLHMQDANILAHMVDTAYPPATVSKIFLDAYEQVSTPNGERYPEVNNAINNVVNKGALIVNYVGHGNENGLAHENILGKSDIQSWRNTDHLPLFITATCEFSRFDDIERTTAGDISRKVSAGEMVLLNPSGGGIALLSTTRLVYSSPNFVLNQNFYKYAFRRDADASFYRLGDLIRISKNLSGPGINKRNFTLLGDPALRLALPSLSIITDSINGVPVASFNDTIKALSKTTVSGHVEDVFGNKLEQFGGIVHPAVYDKERMITTLDNDGFGPMQFGVQNNVIYKGKASVNQGNFRFSFIVPRDISLAVGKARIGFYASDGSNDGAGSHDDALVGGFSGNAAADRTGPAVQLYMNDLQFVPGGMTDENPVLLAVLNDSSGINTVGTGIGHDITAQLDDNTRDLYILNEYYQAETDSYRKGSIRYPLRSLDPGPHTLKLKVWDVYNNSSEETIGFVVKESDRLRLDHVLNYPNPFTTHTTFFFEHNRPGQELDVILQVFTVSGRLIRTIERTMITAGYRSDPVEWDGRDDAGDKIGRGVYLYRLTVRSYDGQTAEQFQKLLIL